MLEAQDGILAHMMPAVVLEPIVPKLTKAAQPLVLPVPGAAVKVLPRWSEEDEVLRWRVRYRPHDADLEAFADNERQGLRAAARLQN